MSLKNAFQRRLKFNNNNGKNTSNGKVDKVPDEEIKEEKRKWEKITQERRKERKHTEEIELKKRLKEMYLTCGDIVGSNLIMELKTIQEKSESHEIHEIIKQVLARKAAIEWRKSGTTRIRSMTEIVPPEEMLEKDFPGLVRSEFDDIKQIEEYQGPKDYQYKEEDLQKIILAEVAKKVAETYNKVGIIDIPQSKRMKELPLEQEELFIEEIQKYVKEAISVEELRNQIKGIKNNELEDLIKLVEQIPEEERRRYINSLNRQIQEGKPEALDLEVEAKLEELRKSLKNLDKENAIEILESAIEDIEDIKKEREREEQL